MLERFRLRPGAVAFSRRGTVMACATADNSIWIWDVVADRPMRLIKVPAASLQEHRESKGLPNPNYIESLAFSPDGKTLAAGNSRIRLWNLETGQLRRTIELSGKAHEKRVSALAFSPNGKVLGAGSFGGALRLWDAVTWQWKATLKGPSSICSIAFAPNSLRLACGGTKISLWDIASKALVRSFEGASYDYSHPQNLVFSPDGKTLVAGGDKTPYTEEWSLFDYGGFFGVVHVWDVVTGALRKTMTFKDERLYSLAYAPNGLTLAVGYSDATRLWSTRGWQLQASLSSTSARAISYVEGSKTLALVSEFAKAKLWSPSSLNRIRLGISIQNATLDKQIITALGLKQSSGARILAVEPGSIAAQRGLRKDDIVLRINGRPVDSPQTVSESIQPLGSGEVVVLTVLRQGRLLTIPVPPANQG